MYAVHHAPSPDAPLAPVLVHVHGLGVEQITLYRQEVRIARAAAALGFPVLRVHARGHGDSGGDFADVTLESLVADARAAADEARRRSGRGRVLWLGVRFGALVAALAARDRADTAGFVLWEPVHVPADFFRTQLRTLLYSQVAGGMKPEASVDELLARLERDGRVDVFGYYLHKPLVDSARGATLAAALAPAAGPVLLAQVQSRTRLAPAHARLAEALAARGVNVATALIHEEPGYQEMSNPAWESPALTAAIGGWLHALA